MVADGTRILTDTGGSTSRVVSPRRRRFCYLMAVAGGVALLVGLSMPGAAAATAASPQTVNWFDVGPQQNERADMCMRAQPVEPYPYYAMVQAQCDSANFTDEYQHWAFGSSVSHPSLPSGRFAQQLYNYGAQACLWAPSAQAGNGGGLFLAPCDANDLNQLWIPHSLSFAAPSSPGGEKAGVVFENAGTGTCIDADGTRGGTAGDRVWQWTCQTDGSDPFQVWAAP